MKRQSTLKQVNHVHQMYVPQTSEMLLIEQLPQGLACNEQ